MAEIVSFPIRPLTRDPASEHVPRDTERVSPSAAQRESELAGELLGRLETALRSANAGETSVRRVWTALVNGVDRES
jgi:hypothetical protein